MPFIPFYHRSDYLRNVAGLLDRVEPWMVTAIAGRVRLVRDRGGGLYVAGNGGSAATASHWVADLAKVAWPVPGLPLRVVSLADSVPLLTALANDNGYERVFADHLALTGRKGDVLVVISVSGNSPNLLRAVKMAQSLDMSTVGLLGSDGGSLRQMVGCAIMVPAGHGVYGPVEDCHLAICHAVVDYLAHDDEKAVRATAWDTSIPQVRDDSGYPGGVLT